MSLIMKVRTENQREDSFEIYYSNQIKEPIKIATKPTKVFRDSSAKVMLKKPDI